MRENSGRLLQLSYASGEAALLPSGRPRYKLGGAFDGVALVASALAFGHGIASESATAQATTLRCPPFTAV